MNRAEALTLVQSVGLNAVMTAADRLTTDSAAGYGPALDRAFRIYVGLNALDTTVTTTTVETEDEEGFEVLLRATAYDLVLPVLALLIDTSVDAPLTSAKFSQTYRQIKELRDDAWKEAAAYGYAATAASAAGFKVNLDFLEPIDDEVQEFA